MKNLNINILINVLSPLMLDVQKSSARRRLIRHLKGFKEDFDLEAEYLRKEFGEKNPDGSLKVINNQVQFTKENRKLVEVKFKELNDLNIVISWTDEEKDKETIIGILDGLIIDIKKASEFNNDQIEYLELLEEIKKELE